MSIENFFCEQCDKYGCCRFINVIAKFSENAKVIIPMNVKCLDCLLFKPLEEKQN